MYSTGVRGLGFPGGSRKDCRLPGRSPPVRAHRWGLGRVDRVKTCSFAGSSHPRRDYLCGASPTGGRPEGEAGPGGTKALAKYLALRELTHNGWDVLRLGQAIFPLKAIRQGESNLATCGSGGKYSG